MKANSAKQAYIDYLISEDKNFVIFDNGDIILADSPRFAEALKAGEKKSCEIKICTPGFRGTRTITIEHGARFYGYERQKNDSCVKKNYDCDDGNLVPF